jgi:hypothetical protein
MKFDLEKEADMHVRLYLDAAVRDQAFIKTGHEYGPTVLLKVPTRSISVRARKELLRMRPDTSRPAYLTWNKPADETIDLGICPPVSVDPSPSPIDLGICPPVSVDPSPSPHDETSPALAEDASGSEPPSDSEAETGAELFWTAPFVPTTPTEWNRLIQQFADYRRHEVQPRLNEWLDRLQTQLAQVQHTPPEVLLAPSSRSVPACYVGLEGYEAVKELVKQMDELCQQRFKAWIAQVKMLLETFDPTRPPAPVAKIPMGWACRWKYDQATDLVETLNARIREAQEQNRDGPWETGDA